MTKKILLLLGLSFSFFSFSQVITIDAFVLNEETKAPIEYVNIGFIHKGIGTVSDNNGAFLLEYKEEKVSPLDILQFSSLGYETLEIEARNLFDALMNTDKIYLKPAPINLSEVTIESVAQIEKVAGGLDSSTGTIGFWRGEGAFGGEIATLIKIKNKNSRVKELKIKVLENLSDSIKLRIKIYDFNKNNPNVNLLNSNIFHTTAIKSGIETINLKPYNIKLDNDVIVSVELLEVFGDKTSFVLAGMYKGGRSYRRENSQDKWQLIRGVKMSFSLLTSYPKEDKATSLERPIPSKITLLWDNSASMGDNTRLISKELDFISAYVKEIQNVDIELIQFNTYINSKKTFKINNGNSKELIDTLKAINYDGGTDYNCITDKEDYNSDTILFVTDGNATLGEFNFETSTPVFTINSKNNANITSLQDLSYYANGSFINLRTNTIESSLDLISNYIEDSETYSGPSTENNLYGKVYDSIGAIEGASIRIKNSFVEAISQEDGSYTIAANYKDTLAVTSIGMKPKEISVPREKKLDIKLTVDGVLLDQVNLKKTTRDEETTNEYTRGSKISQKQIRPDDLFMSDLLRRVPGVRVVGPRENASYSLLRNQTFNSSNFTPITGFLGNNANNGPIGISNVDGPTGNNNVDGPTGNTTGSSPQNIANTMGSQDFQNMTTPRAPLFFLNGGLTGDINVIDPQMVESIVVLKSLAETNIYGSEGIGGVIKITTKNGNWKKRTNTALVKGNDYGDVPPKIDLTKITTNINNIIGSNSYEQAYQFYLDKKKSETHLGTAFFIEVSDYFMKWDKEKAYAILTNLADISYNDAKALKVLAYKLEEINKLDEALLIYERILELRPKHAQSYRDVALMYQNTGHYEKAMSLYKQMLSNSISGVDFTGIQKTLVNELRQLLIFHKSKVDFKGLPEKILKLGFKMDFRVVFEWTDANFDFEIQFVDPGKKYFIWKHTALGNRERLLEEAEQGFSMEEFLIDDSQIGDWIVNIKAFSEDKLFNPTFLKYTIYRDYGLPSQTKTTKVIKLYDQKEKVTIDKFRKEIKI